MLYAACDQISARYPQGWCPPRRREKPGAGGRCAACQELVHGLWHHLPTTHETAGQADKKRVVSMVEEVCHVVEMRRLAFKESPAVCELLEERTNEVAKVLYANCKEAQGEDTALEGVCTDILEVCTPKQLKKRIRDKLDL